MEIGKNKMTEYIRIIDEDIRISTFGLKQDGFMPLKKSGVSIYHIPSGIEVSSSENVTQEENVIKAMKLLEDSIAKNHTEIEIMHHPV